MIAVVGEKPILESSVDEQVAAYLQAFKKGGVEIDSLKKSILNYLIEQEVLVYFAKKDTMLSVDDVQVSALVGERLSFFKNQFETRPGIGCRSQKLTGFGPDFGPLLGTFLTHFLDHFRTLFWTSF